MKFNFAPVFPVLLICLTIGDIFLVKGDVDCAGAINNATAECEKKAAYTPSVGTNPTKLEKEGCCLIRKYEDCLKSDFPKDASCKTQVDVFLGALDGAIKGAKCEQYTCGSWAVQASVTVLVATLALTAFAFLY